MANLLSRWFAPASNTQSGSPAETVSSPKAFRPFGKQPNGRSTNSGGSLGKPVGLTTDKMLQRARQIKEVLRLGNALRADIGLQEVLTQIIGSIRETLGYGSAVLYLVKDGSSPALEAVAFVGISPEKQTQLSKTSTPLKQTEQIMRPEFKISQSFFIRQSSPPESFSSENAPKSTTSQFWAPDDRLLVPLNSTRTGQLLGILQIDEPLDGSIPSEETVEITELFATLAALAIDNARLFEEAERERENLEAAVFDLLREVEEARVGNLTVRAKVTGTSLGAVADSFNEMLKALQGVLLEVREAAAQVTTSALEVQSSAQKLSEGAQSQSMQIADVSAAIEEMALSVRQVSENSSNAATVAQEALRTAEEGHQVVEKNVEGMNTIRGMTLQSAKKIKKLGESSQEIGEIVQLISDIANQTNLLALNASIEAARAGEHGRGFSVVAQEIRNLANRSADAAKQVSSRIKSIQSETTEAVISIENSTQQVVKQSELAAQAGEALESIDNVTQRIAELIEGISLAAGQQARASSTVAQSMNEISQITFQTTYSINLTSASMARLAELAEHLRSRVAIFKLGQ